MFTILLAVLLLHLIGDNTETPPPLDQCTIPLSLRIVADSKKYLFKKLNNWTFYNVKMFISIPFLWFWFCIQAINIKTTNFNSNNYFMSSKWLEIDDMNLCLCLRCLFDKMTWNPWNKNLWFIQFFTLSQLK